MLLRDINLPECFLPWLFSSQMNENFFRTLRSIATAEYTQINFSPKECLGKAKKIETRTVIEAKLLKLGLEVPGLQEQSSEKIFIPDKLPTNDEILQALKSAKYKAVNQLKKLGIHLMSYGTVLKPQYQEKEPENTNLMDELNYSEDYDNLTENDADVDEAMYMEVMSNVEVIISDSAERFAESPNDTEVMKDLCGIVGPKKFCIDNSQKAYFQMKTEECEEAVSKQLFCWAAKDRKRSSNDRLQRFIPTDKKSFQAFNVEHGVVQKLDIVQAGDWIILKNTPNIYQILHFIVTVKSPEQKVKTKPFSRDYAFVENPNQEKPDKKKKKVCSDTTLSMLCHSFQLNEDHEMTWIASTDQYIPISDYFAHIISPKSTKSSPSSLKELFSILEQRKLDPQKLCLKFT